MSQQRVPSKNYAFIDGSFNPDTKVYGCGGFLIDQYGKKHIIQMKGSDPAMAKMRNVAGEILGAMRAVYIAQKLGMKKLTIFHDYEGVAAWVLGKWKCKKPETRHYAMVMWKAMENGLKLYFRHVKGHSGVPENEEADQLAKLAVGLGKAVIE